MFKGGIAKEQLPWLHRHQGMEGSCAADAYAQRRVSALELGVFSFCLSLVLRAMHRVWSALLCRLGTQLESRTSCCDRTHLKLWPLYHCCGPMEPRIVFTQAEKSFETEKETGALNSPNKQEVDNLK